MIKRKISKNTVSRWLIVFLPVLALTGVGTLPLKPFVSQALIAVILIWFQASIMLGFFGS